MMYAAETKTMSQKQEKQQEYLPKLKVININRINRYILEELTEKDVIRKINRQRMIGTCLESWKQVFNVQNGRLATLWDKRKGCPRSTWIKTVKKD